MAFSKELEKKKHKTLGLCLLMDFFFKKDFKKKKKENMFTN
jgi:energy-converting hydrogenase A subunit M